MTDILKQYPHILDASRQIDQWELSDNIKEREKWVFQACNITRKDYFQELLKYMPKHEVAQIVLHIDPYDEFFDELNLYDYEPTDEEFTTYQWEIFYVHALEYLHRDNLLPEDEVTMKKLLDTSIMELREKVCEDQESTKVLALNEKNTQAALHLFRALKTRWFLIQEEWKAHFKKSAQDFSEAAFTLSWLSPKYTNLKMDAEYLAAKYYIAAWELDLAWSSLATLSHELEEINEKRWYTLATAENYIGTPQFEEFANFYADTQILMAQSIAERDPTEYFEFVDLDNILHRAEIIFALQWKLGNSDTYHDTTIKEYHFLRWQYFLSNEDYIKAYSYFQKIPHDTNCIIRESANQLIEELVVSWGITLGKVIPFSPRKP